MKRISVAALVAALAVPALAVPALGQVASNAPDPTGPGLSAPGGSNPGDVIGPIWTTWDSVEEIERTLRPRVENAPDPDPVSPYLAKGVRYKDPWVIAEKKARIAAYEAACKEAAALGLPAPQYWGDRNAEPDGAGPVFPSGGEIRAITGPGTPADPTVVPDGPRDLSSGGEFRPWTPGDPGDPTDAPTAWDEWDSLDDDACPHDPCAAVGAAHVGVIVNFSLAFYTKDGSLARGPVSLASWWSGAPAGTDLFDPKITYDPHENRFVMMALNGRRLSEVYYAIAISATSNPEEGWWIYYLRSDLDGSTDTGNWADYPGLGFDSGDNTSSLTTGGGFYITANMFTASDVFQYAKLRVLRKHQLYNGSGTVSWWDFWGFDDATGGNLFTWKPAQMLTATADPVLYLLNTHDDGSDELTWYSLTDPLASGPALTGPISAPTALYDVPPNALAQGTGTRIHTGDCRTQDVYYRLGYLYTAHLDEDDWGTGIGVEATIQYNRILAGFPVAIWATEFGLDESYYYYPHIVPDVDLDTTIVFNRSSLTEYAAMRCTGRLVSETVTQSSSEIKAGEGAYTDCFSSSRNAFRWGDYNGACVDCAGDQKGAYVYAMYAQDDLSSGTWVGAVSFGQPNVQHLADNTRLTSGLEQRYFTWEMTSFDWSGVALDPDPAGSTWLAASTTCPFGTPYQNSTFGLDTLQFVVANGSSYGAGYHHARATYSSGDVGYTIEARTTSFDVGVGLTTAGGFDISTENLDLYEAALTSGKTYAVEVVPGAGLDVDVFLFEGSRFNGRRADNDGSAQSAGAGSTETAVFTASETSTYGFAVTNENSVAADYTIKVWLKPLVASIGDSSTCQGSSYTGPTPSLTEGSGPVVWTLAAGPAGMSINSVTGVVSWPVPTAGVHLVTIRAANPAGLDDESWFLTVTPLLGGPTGVAATDGSFCDKTTVSWNAVTGATSYQVWRNTVNNSATATQIGTDTASPFDDTTGTPGLTYFYWVKAVNSCGPGAFSASNSGFRAATLPPPTGVDASDGQCGRIRVDWDAVAGATNYHVYRGTVNNPALASFLATDTLSPYIDTAVTANVTYYYWVRSEGTCGVGAFGSSDSGFAAFDACNCDTSTGTDVCDFFDFVCFQDRFSVGDPYACDCDLSTGVGVCDFFDFVCFQDAFSAGCP